jgi:glycosyltransferase involved in cell wall biosynthesis
MLIKLMPQLQQVNQFFRLVIVGDGPDMKMLQSVVRNLGLERKVFLVGRKSAADVALYYAASDMFVLNTGYEGFSHQVLEAMQAGVPVITTTAGGNPEAVVQGSNGFMVRYNDEFNLVEAIKTLWKQAELRDQMIANGKHTVAAFSIENMYTQTVQLLTETFK